LSDIELVLQIGIALLSPPVHNARLKIRAIGIWRALFYLPNLLMPRLPPFFSLFSFLAHEPISGSAGFRRCNFAKRHHPVWLFLSSGGPGLGRRLSSLWPV
jgi:hypothetical protein